MGVQPPLFPAGATGRLASRMGRISLIRRNVGRSGTQKTISRAAPSPMGPVTRAVRLRKSVCVVCGRHRIHTPGQDPPPLHRVSARVCECICACYIWSVSRPDLKITPIYERGCPGSAAAGTPAPTGTAPSPSWSGRTHDSHGHIRPRYHANRLRDSLGLSSPHLKQQQLRRPWRSRGGCCRSRRQCNTCARRRRQGSTAGHGARAHQCPSCRGGTRSGRPA